ncbi:hypothetical protein BDZ94DRAFT_1315523 [Collybia nuda]|uniref:Uncharacterized protein n=1 Tax=Collybia nuda TaxID=64659 RepID=A0A9P6CBI6_9AGAR|nr:hypothetical protein BDZ94DRAFT_1315523 [Collybia nuda]
MWHPAIQSSTPKLNQTQCAVCIKRKFLNIKDLSNPTTQGDIPFIISAYKLSPTTSPSSIPSDYDTHSIPGYTISLRPATFINKTTSSTYSDIAQFTTDTPIDMLSNPSLIDPTTRTSHSNSSTTINLVSNYAKSKPSEPSQTITKYKQTKFASSVSMSQTSTLCQTHNISSSPEQGAFTSSELSLTRSNTSKSTLSQTIHEQSAFTTKKIMCNFQGDPLADISILSPITTNFTPTGQYNEDAYKIIEKNHPPGFLTTEERRLMHNCMMHNNNGFTWKESQKGLFCKDFFPPVRMPITEHVPWAL